MCAQVTVANSFEAPIKLLVPKDVLTNALQSSSFTMLGLGDIIVPGASFAAPSQTILISIVQLPPALALCAIHVSTCLPHVSDHQPTPV